MTDDQYVGLAFSSYCRFVVRHFQVLQFLRFLPESVGVARLFFQGSSRWRVK